MRVKCFIVLIIGVIILLRVKIELKSAKVFKVLLTRTGFDFAKSTFVSCRTILFVCSGGKIFFTNT